MPAARPRRTRWRNFCEFMELAEGGDAPRAEPREAEARARLERMFGGGDVTPGPSSKRTESREDPA